VGRNIATEETNLQTVEVPNFKDCKSTKPLKRLVWSLNNMNFQQSINFTHRVDIHESSLWHISGFGGGKRTTHPASPPSWFPYIDRRVRWWWHVVATSNFLLVPNFLSKLKTDPSACLWKKSPKTGNPWKGQLLPSINPAQLLPSKTQSLLCGISTSAGRRIW